MDIKNISKEIEEKLQIAENQIEEGKTVKAQYVFEELEQKYKF